LIDQLEEKYGLPGTRALVHEGKLERHTYFFFILFLRSVSCLYGFIFCNIYLVAAILLVLPFLHLRLTRSLGGFLQEHVDFVAGWVIVVTLGCSAIFQYTAPSTQNVRKVGEAIGLV
jgi:hypothetical protein